MSHVAFNNHFVAHPGDTEVQHVVEFGDPEEPPVDFVGWVSPTYIDAFGSFNKGTGYAMDILDVDDTRLKARRSGGVLGPDDVAGLRRSGYAARGRSMRARLRVFGGDLAVVGYACALPLDQIDDQSRTRRQKLEVGAGAGTLEYTFEFNHGVDALVWTAISMIDPRKRFDQDNAVAIDVPRINGQATASIAAGGDHLGAYGTEAAQHVGVAFDHVTSITVRLRCFGPDISAAGYAIVLYRG